MDKLDETPAMGVERASNRYLRWLSCLRRLLDTRDTSHLRLDAKSKDYMTVL